MCHPQKREPELVCVSKTEVEEVLCEFFCFVAIECNPNVTVWMTFTVLFPEGLVIIVARELYIDVRVWGNLSMFFGFDVNTVDVGDVTGEATTLISNCANPYLVQSQAVTWRVYLDLASNSEGHRLLTWSLCTWIS